jgi:hypothetical protein
MLRKLSLIIIFLLLAIPCYATDYTQDPNCVLAYLFATGSGTSVTDSSTVGTNTGTFKSSGHPAWSSTVPNAHVSFSANYATGDYINGASAATLDNISPISFVAWVKPTSVSATMDFYDKGSSLQFNSFYIDPTGVLKFQRKMSGNTLSRTSNGSLIAAGSYQHIAVTWDGTITDSTKVHIYINGTEVAYSAGTNGSGSLGDDSANNFLLGIGSDASTFGYAGLITEVGVFSRVLTPTEINDIMNNGLKQVSGSSPIYPGEAYVID